MKHLSYRNVSKCFINHTATIQLCVDGDMSLVYCSYLEYIYIYILIINNNYNNAHSSFFFVSLSDIRRCSSSVVLCWSPVGYTINKSLSQDKTILRLY